MPRQAGKSAKADLQGYDGNAQVGALLRRAYQRHISLFQDHMGPAAITSVQFSALYNIEVCGPLSQKSLVEVTSIDQATIRGVLDRLKSRGLIAFGKDPLDRRKVMISITAKGRKQVEKMVPKAFAVSDATCADLSPAEKEDLMNLLARIALAPEEA